MHDSTAVHLHIIQQSTVLQAIWFAAEKANSSWIPAWQGDCAWNHAKHMSSWLDVHSSMRYTHGSECIFLRVYMCKRVYVCVGPRLTGCWHILITLGSCCFWPRVAGCKSFTSQILRHYIILSSTHGVFDYDNVIKKTYKTPFLENDNHLNQSGVLRIMDYITLKNSLHLFTGIFYN